MTTGNYPVIEERALPPVERRRTFRVHRRDPETLPAQAPGTVYVFEYDGRYQDPYSRRVLGTEPHVINATAVSLVQMRDRLVTVRRSMPSARAGINLVVSVAFRCLVTDAVVVAGGGLTDLESVLATHVAADRELATLGRIVRPERAADAVLRIEAQLRAHCTVNPPDVRGIEAVVVAVEVHAEPTVPTSFLGERELDELELGVAELDVPGLSLYEQAETLLQARFGRRGGPRRDEDEHAR